MLVSVIIPAYNTEEYIGKCLCSVCTQTYSNLEIIVINDASTDGTLDIIKSFEAKDNRIILIDQPTNKGNGIGRNTAIRQAKGKYIMFVDSDDTLRSNAIEKLVDVVKTNFTDVVFLGYTMVKYDKKGNITLKRDYLPKVRGDESAEQLFKCFLTHQKNVNIQCWSNFTRRQLLIDKEIFFDESGHYLEDNIYAARLYLNINTFSFIKESLYDYTVRVGSIMHSYTRRTIEGRIHAVLQVKDMLKEKGVFEQYKDVYTYFFVVSGFMMSFLDCVRMESPDSEVIKFLKELSQNVVIKNFYFVKLDLPYEVNNNGISESNYKRTKSLVHFVSNGFRFAYMYYRVLFKISKSLRPVIRRMTHVA
ncbi:MAG: glycosyltransferase family 2 protein [Marinilabiliaceae bacterium]|nr:glycosyltransferase family 2 protein [Marinilabiliaceae bacterium]